MPPVKAVKTTMSEASNLLDGPHPAYLLAITDEATPESFINHEKNPRSYLWHFAVYQTMNSVGRETPEYLSAWSTQICSYGGKRPSKCYEWTTTLLGRQMAVGESVDLDPMMPLACQVTTSRKDNQGNPKDFATITGLYTWPEGTPLLQNAVFFDVLTRFWEAKKPEGAPSFPGRGNGQHSPAPAVMPAPGPMGAPAASVSHDIPF